MNAHLLARPAIPDEAERLAMSDALYEAASRGEDYLRIPNTTPPAMITYLRRLGYGVRIGDDRMVVTWNTPLISLENSNDMPYALILADISKAVHDKMQESERHAAWVAVTDAIQNSDATWCRVEVTDHVNYVTDRLVEGGFDVTMSRGVKDGLTISYLNIDWSRV